MNTIPKQGTAKKYRTFYHDLPFPFRMSPVRDIESDLLEAQFLSTDPIAMLSARLQGLSQPDKIRRVFLVGANPFVLQFQRLKTISELIHRYFPTVESIGCFARIYFFYLAGISGAGRGIECALNSAKVFNMTNPKMTGSSMLTIFPESELYQEIKWGNWREESEIEKLKELKTLIENLTIRTKIVTDGASNLIKVCGFLPDDRDKLTRSPDRLIKTADETALREDRVNLRHL